MSFGAQKQKSHLRVAFFCVEHDITSPPKHQYVPVGAALPRPDLRRPGSRQSRFCIESVPNKPARHGQAANYCGAFARASKSTPICNIKCGKSMNTQFSLSVPSATRHQSITRMLICLLVAGTPR